jgi:hypothetical protein
MVDLKTASAQALLWQPQVSLAPLLPTAPLQDADFFPSH